MSSSFHKAEGSTLGMESPGVEDWRAWHRQGFSRLPIVRVQPEASLPPTWDSVTDRAAAILLESAQSGRYSYICGAADRVIIGQVDQAQIWSGDCVRRTGSRSGPPLTVLAELLREKRAPKLPRLPAMCGGLMGLIGFDAVRTWERLPTSAKRDLAIPLYAMIEPGEVYVYDHRDRILNIIIWSDVLSGATLLESFEAGTEVADRAWRRWQEACTTREGGALHIHSHISASEIPLPSFSGEQFQRAVTRIQEYIAAGDAYQVNLSLRTSRPARVSPSAIYSALRRINPSPYMGFLQLPEFALVCGSPELLVRLVDGVVSSRPIAGTRPRGEAEMQDRLYSAELLASEKERAEHLMLVDLIRNDIGRVAEYGTVHVSEFMAVEQYSHVMHIVSQVEGRLAEGKTWVEVFESMFPGGTITGCPKIRTMEIIEELEPVGRGFYTGAMGWISYSGEMEMNIVIRSMLVEDGVAHVQAGAGIVADSMPARELDEALRKAEALWVALTEATASQENE